MRMKRRRRRKRAEVRVMNRRTVTKRMKKTSRED
jgi:hypothetical protein